MPAVVTAFMHPASLAMNDHLPRSDRQHANRMFHDDGTGQRWQTTAMIRALKNATAETRCDDDDERKARAPAANEMK